MNEYICPDCGRNKAKCAQDVMDGLCPKWWAIFDKDAEKDCVNHILKLKKEKNLICDCSEDEQEPNSGMFGNICIACGKPVEDYPYCDNYINLRTNVIIEKLIKNKTYLEKLMNTINEKRPIQRTSHMYFCLKSTIENIEELKELFINNKFKEEGEEDG